MHSLFQAKFAQNRSIPANFAQSDAHFSKICARIPFSGKTLLKRPAKKAQNSKICATRGPFQQNLRKPTRCASKKSANRFTEPFTETRFSMVFGAQVSTDGIHIISVLFGFGPLSDRFGIGSVRFGFGLGRSCMRSMFIGTRRIAIHKFSVTKIFDS